MVNLGSTEVRRPNLFINKPFIKRPEFSMDNPGAQKRRQPVIRGAGSSRCFFCGSLVSSKAEMCTACGSTIISPEAIMDNNDVKKRMKYLNIKKGYEGS